MHGRPRIPFKNRVWSPPLEAPRKNSVSQGENTACNDTVAILIECRCSDKFAREESRESEKREEVGLSEVTFETKEGTRTVYHATRGGAWPRTRTRLSELHPRWIGTSWGAAMHQQTC
ncbi:uncharacterized protein LOC143186010 [Calliopsis andreniformis]|uniref:uncharacterized protein LOC143186010 n=1 Tax=Calliopsis andreniformis TaxID=337506 RepID=UPI003FCC7DEA